MTLKLKLRQKMFYCQLRLLKVMLCYFDFTKSLFISIWWKWASIDNRINVKLMLCALYNVALSLSSDCAFNVKNVFSILSCKNNF